jgi:hypothetical protein
MPRLTNPPPRLADKRLAVLYSVMAACWFMAWVVIGVLWQVTLIQLHEAIRITMGLAGGIALLFAVMRKPWRLDGWSSFLYGFFGLVPIGLAMFLLLNLAIGPVRTVELPIVAIESHAGSTDRAVVLLNDDYADEPLRVRGTPHDPAVWYAAALQLELREGVLGYMVVLDRRWLPSSPARLLPEVRR